MRKRTREWVKNGMEEGREDGSDLTAYKVQVRLDGEIKIGGRKRKKDKGISHRKGRKRRNRTGTESNIHQIMDT